MSSSAIRRSAPSLAVTAALATAQVFPLASNPLLACNVPAPGKLVLEAKSFTVRAEGNLQTAGAYTAKISLLGALVMPAAPLVAANWTLLGSGTARAVGTTWSPWWIEARCICESQSGALQGTFQQMVNNLFDGSAALANQITGINGTNFPVVQAGPVTVQPADPILYFAAAVTFGTAGANLANLMNLEIAF